MTDKQVKQGKFFEGFVGQKLKEAREARGYTAVFLAEQVGVTRATISNYENTKRTPTSQIFQNICKVLRLPAEYFIDDDLEIAETETPIFYRSLAAATKRARTQAETQFKAWFFRFSRCLSFIELPTVNLPEIIVPADPMKLSVWNIEDIAGQVRKFWRLGDGPISNFVWLLENNGIIVIRRSLGSDDLDAFSAFINGRPYIVLNSDKNSAARSRFDAAHELGHLILHKHLPEAFFQTPEYFKLLENQAHRFAAAILFPQTSFAKEVVNVNLELFRILKKRWKLSIKMMVKRAEDLDFLNEKASQNIWRSYARKGWNQSEPFDDEIPVETPKLLFNCVELLLHENVLTREEMLSTARLSYEDLEDCVGLPRNFLNPKAGEVRRLQPRLRENFDSNAIPKRPGQIINFPNATQLES